MHKKLNLDKTQEFQVAIATHMVVKSLLAHLDGLPGILSIGSEQGDIPTWDDLIAQDEFGDLIHYQVKRNKTDFNDFSCNRGLLKRGPNLGQPQPLSPLDESIKALAEWTEKKDISKINPKRRFVLCIPVGEVKIKNEISAAQFETFCNDQIKNITDIVRFKDLASTNSVIANIVTWLTTWCGFIDEVHILKTVKLLRVSLEGNASDIYERTKELLSSHFVNSEVVYSLIKGYLIDNTSFTVAITPRALLDKVRPYLSLNVTNWTQYKHVNGGFEKRGTCDTRHECVELPDAIVPMLWNDIKRGILKLDSPVDITPKLNQSIIQLTLHLQAGSVAHLTNFDGWKQAYNHAVGGTLGLAKDDLDNINAIPCIGAKLSSEYKGLGTIAERDAEAASLEEEMQKVTWVKVCQHVENEISTRPGSPLKEAVEIRWRKWRELLDVNLLSQQQLSNSMLHPNAEGKDINGKLRVGPKTSELIAKGIFMLLIVSVCLNGTDDDWTKVGDALTVNTIANRQWSGPSGEIRNPRKLSERGREKLLAGESAKIVIFSEVEASANELRDVSLASVNSKQQSLAAPKEPNLIVTYNPRFSDLIYDGDIFELELYLRKNYLTLA